jgi:putative hydrolase of the HAD superfamily
MTAIRNVIFDLGGVVLDWNPDQIVSRFQPDAALRENFKKDVFGHSDWQLFDRGALTELEMIDRIESRTGLSKNQAVNIMDSVRESLVEKSETVRLMRALHSRGLALFCLSNMPTSIYTHLRERHGFWDLFSGIVISGEIRMMKPEAAVFDYLLGKFAISASESVFVDDLAPNIEGAIAVGLQGVLFQDARQCERDLDRLLIPRASAAAAHSAALAQRAAKKK